MYSPLSVPRPVVVQEAEFNRVHRKRAELQLAKVSPTQAIATGTRVRLEQSVYCT